MLTGTASVVCIGNYAKELASYTRGTGSLSLSIAGDDLCHNPEEVIEAAGYLPESDIRNSPDSVFCAHGAGFVVPWNEVYDNMHLPHAYDPEKDERRPGDGEMITDEEADNRFGTGQDTGGFRARLNESGKPGGQSTGGAIGTDEIDSILNKTFYANSDSTVKAEADKRKGVGKTSGANVVSTGGKISDPYDDFKYSPVKKREKYLLVDGYNVIYAWKELRELAGTNIDGARDRLTDIMHNYSGAVDSNVVLVFDAYKVKGRVASETVNGNFRVVYTGEDETADRYIERFANLNGRKYEITVATSDRLEQIITRGNNCYLLSSRELEAVVMDELNRLMKGYST